MNKSTASVLLLLFHAWQITAQSPWAWASKIEDNNYYGVCAVAKNKVVACAERGELYQSSDGGNTIIPYQLANSYSLFYDVKFRNPQEGFAGGGCYFPTGSCVVNVIATTTDGGQHWDWEPVAPGLGVFVKLSLLPDGTIFALSDYEGLYRRLPNSLTWDYLGKPDTAHFGTYTNVQFLDTNHGFAELWSFQSTGNENHLLRTEDGGQSWTEVSTIVSQGQRPVFFFTDPQNGFRTTYYGELSRTDDGGLHWEPEQVFGTDEAIMDLEIVSPDILYLSTYETPSLIGRVYRSNDGGDSWILDFQADSSYIEDIDFLDAENGFAMASYRQIYRRTGNVPVLNPKPQALFSIQPNPVRETAMITVPEGIQGSTLQVFDVLGRERLQMQLEVGHTEYSLDSSPLKPGVYFLTLPGTGLGAVKFVVE